MRTLTSEKSEFVRTTVVCDVPILLFRTVRYRETLSKFTDESSNPSIRRHRLVDG